MASATSVGESHIGKIQASVNISDREIIMYNKGCDNPIL